MEEEQNARNIDEETAEPVTGLELMAERRGTREPLQLCSGPGKLCAALGITKAQYGLDLCGSALWIEDYRSFSPAEIALSPRVNIDYAVEYRDRLWRYSVKDSPFVSRAPARYRPQGTLAEFLR